MSTAVIHFDAPFVGFLGDIADDTYAKTGLGLVHWRGADCVGYSAIDELESAEVLTSAAWAKAVDAGRWPGEVRPYTRNRRHVLKKLDD